MSIGLYKARGWKIMIGFNMKGSLMDMAAAVIKTSEFVTVTISNDDEAEIFLKGIADEYKISVSELLKKFDSNDDEFKKSVQGTIKRIYNLP